MTLKPSPKKPLWVITLAAAGAIALLLGGLAVVLAHNVSSQQVQDSRVLSSPVHTQSDKEIERLTSPKNPWRLQPTNFGYKIALPESFTARSAGSVESTFAQDSGGFLTTVRTLSIKDIVGQRAFQAWKAFLTPEALLELVKPLSQDAKNVRVDAITAHQVVYDKTLEDGKPANCEVAPILTANKVVITEVCSTLDVGYATMLLSLVEKSTEDNSPSTMYRDMQRMQQLQAANDAELAAATSAKQKTRIQTAQKMWESRRGLSCFGKSTAIEFELCYEKELDDRMAAVAGGVDSKDSVVVDPVDTQDSSVELNVPDTEVIDGTGSAMGSKALPTIKDTQ